MTWFDYFLLAWWTYGALASVALVGKPRKPLEPGTAVVIVAMSIGMAVALLFTRGVL